MDNWKEFEILIKKIQSETASDAIVKRNHIVVGESGRKRQLDITISKKVGLYPVLIVIECKKYSRPVGIEKVEAFVTKLRDVGASQGVIVSNTGFTKGAKAIAKQNLITLQSYREAKETDWQSIVGSESWIKATLSKNEKITSTFTYYSNGFEKKLDSEEKLFDAQGNFVCTLNNVIQEVIKASASLKPVGNFTLEGSIEPPLFFREAGELCEIIKFESHGVNRAWVYVINLKLASGHVLEDALTGKQVYEQVETESIDWSQILPSGREISEQEYETIKEESGRTFRFDPSSMKRFLKLVITKSD